MKSVSHRVDVMPDVSYATIMLFGFRETGEHYRRVVFFRDNLDSDLLMDPGLCGLIYSYKCNLRSIKNQNAIQITLEVAFSGTL